MKKLINRIKIISLCYLVATLLVLFLGGITWSRYGVSFSLSSIIGYFIIMLHFIGAGLAGWYINENIEKGVKKVHDKIKKV